MVILVAFLSLLTRADYMDLERAERAERAAQDQVAEAEYRKKLAECANAQIWARSERVANHLGGLTGRPRVNAYGEYIGEIFFATADHSECRGVVGRFDERGKPFDFDCIRVSGAHYGDRFYLRSCFRSAHR